MRDDEISLMKGAIVTIMEKSPDGWWRGECGQGKVGWFPSNYVQELYDMHSNTPQQVPSESRGGARAVLIACCLCRSGVNISSF